MFVAASTSVLVLGGLLHGAQCSKRSAENVRAVEKELSGIRILSLPPEPEI